MENDILKKMNEINYIDSASIMNVISALTLHDSIEDWGQWEKYSFVNVTGALSFSRLFRISPGPIPFQFNKKEPYSKLYSCYDLACNELSRFVYESKVEPFYMGAAKDTLKKWVENNKEYAIKSVEKTIKDPGCDHWEKWAIEHAWVDHSNRLNGLFNKDMIDELSIILQEPTDKLNNLWKKTLDTYQVKKWARGEIRNNEFDLVNKAYLTSAILRGRIHEFISVCEERYNYPHPLRHNIIPFIGKKYYFKIPPVLDGLIWLSALGSMSETKPEERIKTWADNIININDEYHKNKKFRLSILERDIDQEDANQIALKLAKRYGVRTYPKSLEKQLDIAIAGNIIAFTYLTSQCLQLEPWQELLLVAGSGIAPIILAFSEPIGQKISKTTLSEKHLNNIPSSEPGRILIVKN